MQNMSLGGVDPAWDKVAGTFVDVQVPVVGGATPMDAVPQRAKAH